MKHSSDDSINKLGYLVSDPILRDAGTTKDGKQYDAFASFCMLPVNGVKVVSVSVDLAFFDEIKEAIDTMEKCQKIVVTGYYGDRNFFYATEIRAVDSWRD